MAAPQAASAGSAVPHVLVTTAPLKPLVDALLTGIGSADMLTHPGQDAHTMTLSPSQARALDSAAIIIVPDRAINPAIEMLLERREKKGVPIIALIELPGADPLFYADSQGWMGDDDERDKKDKKGKKDKKVEEKAEKISDDRSSFNDPHIWLDPLRMAAIATPLAEAMAKQSPQNHTALLANAQALSSHLTQEVHPAIGRMLAQRKGTPKYESRDYIPFITGHSAYQYFLSRYGIADGGALISRPEDYLGARSMHDMLARAGEISVGCLIVETPNSTVRRVAEISGATVHYLSPENLVFTETIPPTGWIQNDYDRLLYVTARTFAGCL